MALQRITVDEFLAATSPRRVDDLIDARSESEYALDHLPGALNWPSLNDEERRLVGTEYKQISAFEARKRGAILVSRNIARHLEREIGNKPRDWSPLIYCWRGGQRSGSLALVLSQIGFDVRVLDGGYRAFRRHVLADLESAGEGLALHVLCGTTGSGKSRLLHTLAQAGEQVIDLEALACHRGSVLGDMPEQPQPSQKHFETRLWAALRPLSPRRPVYIESESRLIGRLRVPEGLLVRMRAAPCIRLEMTADARVDGLMQDYRHFVDRPTHLAQRLDSLRDIRGHATIDRWQALLAEGEVRAVVSELLRDHYDPIYLRSMSRNFAHFDNAPTLHLHSAEAPCDAASVLALQALTTDPVARAPAEASCAATRGGP